MKKTLCTLLAAAMTFSMAACSSGSASSAADSSAAVSSAAASVSEKEQPSEAPVYKAQEYLSNMPFSRKALIDQLVYLGYSEYSAQRGVDEYGADWVEQAKRTLEEYGSDLSKEDAVQMLLDKGFTQEEADEAVK